MLATRSGDQIERELYEKVSVPEALEDVLRVD